MSPTHETGSPRNGVDTGPVELVTVASSVGVGVPGGDTFGFSRVVRHSTDQEGVREGKGF